MYFRIYSILKNLKLFRFLKPTQPDLNNIKSPINFYTFLVTHELISEIVDKTNKNAHKTLRRTETNFTVGINTGWTLLLTK